MREIKFRVWDTYNKIMCVVYHLEWIQGEMWVDGIPHCGNSRRTLMVKHNPIMQYTGLHDKNGRELFEGDLIKIIPRFPKEDGTEYLRDDCFEIDDFCGCVSYFEQMVHPSNGEPEVEFEIIGNIYEHPELLQ